MNSPSANVQLWFILSQSPTTTTNVSFLCHSDEEVVEEEPVDSPFELLNLLANFFYLTSIYLCSKKCKYETITISRTTLPSHSHSSLTRSPLCHCFFFFCWVLLSVPLFYLSLAESCWKKIRWANNSSAEKSIETFLIYFPTPLLLLHHFSRSVLNEKW